MDVPSGDDGLKWFGEGFDGFPKRLPEDCVEYVIHVIDAKQRADSATATRSRLNRILKASNDLKKKNLTDYIWQRDAFELKLHPQPAARPDQHQTTSTSHIKRPHLKGRTNFGDSIADEWLIVYLLLELSKQFPDAWIRIYDTDGDFLLIEAAGALPKWLHPDIAENRVWISNGHLRIIPLPSNDIKPALQNLSLADALDFISTSPDKLIISPFIEDEAFHRIRDYPAAISASFHNALVSIPRNLAFLLRNNPSYISPAIESFYLRDPVSLRPLTTKDISTLTFPPEDFVTVSVKFTKVGFAQLRSQIFNTPPAWVGVTPRLKDVKVEMGMKVACGMEMLVADRQSQDKREVREIRILLKDVENGKEQLPTDSEIATWQHRQDDEAWLDIDYNEFENELSGKMKGKDQSTPRRKGFGDTNAEENLRKMVSRFEDFLNDDTAGAEGIDDDDIDDGESETSGTNPSEGEDKDTSFDEAEFEKAMKEMMKMPPDELEKNGLLHEARKLALEDESIDPPDGEDAGEDEEMKKVIQAMEQELKGHGALDLSNGMLRKKETAQQASVADGKSGKQRAVFFGPERPPDMLGKKDVRAEESADEIGPGDGELSSDDEEFNDVDLGLAKNMLESFKGQAGLSGPAGNLMRAMGVNMPRDEGTDSD